jgi:uncharacterized protein YjbI with pentapeptide repeats
MSETPTKNSRRKAGLAYFWREWWGLLVVAFVSLVSIVFFAVLIEMGQLDTGFDEYTPPTSDTRQAKTLWDWMDLILVPYILGAGAALFTWVTNKRARDAEEKRITERQGIEERRLKEQRDIEQDRSREAALQTYLDRMTELLKEGLRTSEANDEKRHIARARTLTILRQLDGERKGLLLRFLHESDLIEEEAIVDLTGADLSDAVLNRVNLVLANLTGADLTRADLGWASLVGASLSKANLSGADLGGANLHEADLFTADLCEAGLFEADLREADLSGAELLRAYLSRADLRGADLSMAELFEADLRGANLEGADLCGACLEGAAVSEAQLAQAKTLEGATLPDGTKYTSMAEPEPTPAEEVPNNAEGQPDQPDSLEAGEVNSV